MIADAAVALGVIGEIAFSKRESRCQAELTRRSNDRLAQAEQRAGDAAVQAFGASMKASMSQMAAAGASTAAGNAMRELAKATERAAKLEKEAAEARVRVAEIEQLTAWRRVTGAQVGQIAELGAALSGVDLLIEFQQGDPEAFTYARDIFLSFKKAGVEKIRLLGNQYPFSTVFGLKCAADNPMLELGVALAFHPWMTPFDKNLSSHLPPEEAAPNLYVFVGPRPPPDSVWEAALPEESAAPSTNEKAK